MTAGAHGKVTNQAIAIATTHGYTTAFKVGAIVSLIGLLISITVIRTPPRLEHHAEVVHVG